MTGRELLARIEAGDPPGILDVRTRWEFGRGHVPGAIHVPFWMLPARLAELARFRGRPLVVYCELGPRAWMAGTALTLAGFRRVQYLDGHMARWRSAGLPQEQQADT